MAEKISDIRKQYDTVKDQYMALKEKASSMKDGALEKVNESISDYNNIIDIIGSGEHIALSTSSESEDASSDDNDSTHVDENDDAEHEEPKITHHGHRKRKTEKIEPMDPDNIKFSDDNDGVVVSSNVIDGNDDAKESDTNNDGYDFL